MPQVPVLRPTDLTKEAFKAFLMLNTMDTVLTLVYLYFSVVLDLSDPTLTYVVCIIQVLIGKYLKFSSNC